MDSTNLLPQISASQAQKEVTVNENFAATSPAMFLARNADTSAGLTWGYLGGRWGGVLKANGTVALTASTTNYLVREIASGDVELAGGSPNAWNDSDNYQRLYAVVCSASAATSWQDHRGGPGGLFGGGSPSEPGSVAAEDVSYDNATSGIAAEDAQAAIDELVAEIEAKTMQSLSFACSDEVTPLTAGTAKFTWRLPYAFTLTSVKASLKTAQSTGSTFTVDVNVSGSSILSTKLTIDNAEKTSATAATPAVLSSTSLADDAEVTVDIDQVGDGTAVGLKVSLIGRST